MHKDTVHSTPLQFTSNTTKMSSSGSREVLEAARKRLASAKSQVSAASQHMKAVMASAQTMCDAADKEYKEANAALEEAENKYEVIDIDADDLGISGRQRTRKQLKDDIAKKEKKISKNDIVYVQSRTWPGKNKPGGVARVSKVHKGGNSTKYDVSYVLGGREKQVNEAFVTLKDDNNLSTNDEDPMLPAGKRSAEKKRSSNKRRKKTKGCRGSVQIYNDDESKNANIPEEIEILHLAGLPGGDTRHESRYQGGGDGSYSSTLARREGRVGMTARGEGGASFPSAACRDIDRAWYMFGGEPRGMPFPRDMPIPRGMPIGGYDGGGYGNYGGSEYGGGFPNPMNGGYSYEYYR